MQPNERKEQCAGCGLPVGGGTAGCRELFEGLLARDFSNVLYFRVHRMLVDTYALQHPDEYCASVKSLAAHLTGLGWILEQDGSRATGSERLRGWLDGAPSLDKPEIPARRGAVTIADVRQAEDPMEHERAVERWARSTWEAYDSLHPVARAWIAAAHSPKKRGASK